MSLVQFGLQKKNSDGDNPAWTDLSKRMEKIDLVFEEIDPNSAIQKVWNHSNYR